MTLRRLLANIAAGIVLAGSHEGGVVLDPFAGAGTTGVVAKEAGREFLGIELNPKYVALAERRIAQASYQPKLEGLCRDR
jgi:site-specific DNA-methyltransferase (adenine-specific)